jgi:hypothetical protein
MAFKVLPLVKGLCVKAEALERWGAETTLAIWSAGQCARSAAPARRG